MKQQVVLALANEPDQFIKSETLSRKDSMANQTIENMKQINTPRAVHEFTPGEGSSRYPKIAGLKNGPNKTKYRDASPL